MFKNWKTKCVKCGKYFVPEADNKVNCYECKKKFVIKKFVN